MIVSDSRIAAEVLGKILRFLGRSFSKAGNKIATIIMKNPGRAIGIVAKNGSAAVSIVTKAALTTIPDFVNFYHAGKGLHLGESSIDFWINFCRLQSYTHPLRQNQIQMSKRDYRKNK